MLISRLAPFSPSPWRIRRPRAWCITATSLGSSWWRMFQATFPQHPRILISHHIGQRCRQCGRNQCRWDRSISRNMDRIRTLIKIFLAIWCLKESSHHLWEVRMRGLQAWGRWRGISVSGLGLQGKGVGILCYRSRRHWNIFKGGILWICCGIFGAIWLDYGWHCKCAIAVLLFFIKRIAMSLPQNYDSFKYARITIAL